MIEILYTRLEGRLSPEIWESCLSVLPASQQEIIKRYRRWEDRQAGLFGKLLLIEALKKYGYGPDCLDNILVDNYGRPFLSGSVDFNISHSGEYVLCATSGRGKVGIDIEKIRAIDLSDFEGWMTGSQWKKIAESDNKFEMFYDYWTMKESVMKADGRGLSLPVQDIHGTDRQAVVDRTTWHIRRIDIDARYCCHLATSEYEPELALKKRSISPNYATK